MIDNNELWQVVADDKFRHELTGSLKSTTSVGSYTGSVDTHL